MTALAELRARGLDAVLAAARRAGGGAEDELLAELAALDWVQLDRQRAALAAPPPPALPALEEPELRPPTTAPGADPAASTLGWQALRAGRVALVTVAGGQASRLGFEAPKGAFPLGPLSGASLFQHLAGQVRRLGELCGRPQPWVLLTGPENHEDTAAFFRQRAHFGLPADAVHFVCQGTLPALSPQGDLLLAGPGRLFRNPDGHGGVFRALASAGLLAELAGRGVDTLYYCQVDNALVRMGDPQFLGLHLGAGAQMSAKVVEKTDPAEKVGVLAVAAGRHCCVEYSDLAPELAAARRADGGLRFRAGNVAMHAFALAFAAALAERPLPLHLARKKVRALAADGLPVEREAVKFETFVFDALPEAATVVVQLAERAEEFAPLKNRVGVDSIASARAALVARNRRWIAAALAHLSLPPEGPVEIEPGLAYDVEDLRGRAAVVELAAGGRLLRRRR